MKAAKEHLTLQQARRIDEAARAYGEARNKLHDVLMDVALKLGPESELSHKILGIDDRITDYPTYLLYMQSTWCGNLPDGTGIFKPTEPLFVPFPIRFQEE